MTGRKDTISVLRVKELLEYDAETGFFERKIKTGSRSVLGRVKAEPDAQGYIKIGLDGRQYYAHRLAWAISTGDWPSLLIDHINENRSDNRLANLREADKSQNGRNRGAPSNNKSGVKGVSWDKAKRKWLVTIAVHAKTHYVGRFADLDAAAAAHRKASVRLHGEFAN